VLGWIGTVVTGIVGLAGILATYRLSGKSRIAQSENLQLSISAENDRNMRSEKRRIYARFMASTSTYVAAEHTLAVKRRKGAADDVLSALRSELNEAMTVMFCTLAEVRLIAPEDVTVLAVAAVQRLIRSTDLTSEFPDIRDGLYKVMRADLGEPPHGYIHAPELAAAALER
jgi:hypothetical protein